MKRELRGRRVLVTGASSGIGKALAEQLAQHGARLVLVARSQEKLAALADRLAAANGEAVPLVADLASDADRQRVIDEAVRRLGGLDVLINNAGIGSFAHFADSSEEI